MRKESLDEIPTQAWDLRLLALGSHLNIGCAVRDVSTCNKLLKLATPEISSTLGFAQLQALNTLNKPESIETLNYPIDGGRGGAGGSLQLEPQNPNQGPCWAFVSGVRCPSALPASLLWESLWYGYCMEF